MFDYRNKTGFYKAANNGNYKGGSVKVKCTYCNKEHERSRALYNWSIKRSITPKFFCSGKCNNKWKSENLSGENAYAWKGGVTPITMAIRNSHKYKKWRAEVFKKDKWTCMECGYKGNDIEAHHETRFKEIMIKYNIQSLRDAINCSELWNVDNGITYCNHCHDLCHSGKLHKERRVA